MKKKLFGIAMLAISLAACDSEQQTSGIVDPAQPAIVGRVADGGVNDLPNADYFKNRVGATVRSPIISLVKTSPFINPIIQGSLPSTTQKLQTGVFTSSEEWKKEVEKNFGASANASYWGASATGSYSRTLSSKLSFSQNSVNAVITRFIPGPVISLAGGTLKPEALLALNDPAKFQNLYGSAIARTVYLGGWFAGWYRWTKKSSSSITTEEIKIGLGLKIKEIAGLSLSSSERTTIERVKNETTEEFGLESSIVNQGLPAATLDKNSFPVVDAFVVDYYNRAWRQEPNYLFAELSIIWQPLDVIPWENVGSSSALLSKIPFQDPNSFGLDSVGLSRNVSSFNIGLGISRRAKFVSRFSVFYTVGGRERHLKDIYWNGASLNYLHEILAKEELFSEDLTQLGLIKFTVVPKLFINNQWWSGIPATFTMNQNRGSRISSMDDGLFPNDFIQDPGNNWRLIMQGDGNLVEYGPHGSVWSNRKIGKGLQYLALEGNGHIVTRTVTNGSLTWNTSGGGSFFQIQGDGNLVLYNSANRAIWARWGL